MEKAPFRSRLLDSPALWTALAGAIVFARFPDWLIQPRLWAEDGPVFFLSARVDGASAVIEPYAGYLHLLPRLIALIGSFLDPSRIPALYAFASLAVMLCVVARVFSPRLGLPCKPLLALAIAAVPTTGEVFLCPTNIQWSTALALVMMLFMEDPRGPFQWAGDIMVLVFAGLTGPFSVFLLPFFAYRAFKREKRATWILFWVIAAAALAQGTELCLNPPAMTHDHAGSPYECLNLAAVLSVRIPLALLGVQAWVGHVGRGAVLAAGLLASAAAAWAMLADASHRRERLTLLIFAALLCVASVSKTRDDTWDYRDTIDGDRYFYIQRVLLVWILATCLHRRSLGVCVAALACATVAITGADRADYIEGPAFTQHHVERPFVDWDRYCADLRAGEEVTVRVSPSWRFMVPEKPGKN